MNIETLFSTPERLKILQDVAFQTDLLNVNQIAARLKLSKGFVSKYLDLLAREGLAKRTNGKFILSPKISLVKGIKVLLNLHQMDPKLFKKYPFVLAVGLYGSCAKGENTEDSDVDLWIRINTTDPNKQAVLAAELRKRIKNVKILFLTEDKIERLRKEDQVFYHALSFGSITLYGNSNALEL